MRTLGSIGGLVGLTALLLAGSPAAAGEPVVLPDITPGATTDFALAFLLQEKVEVALQREGHIVLTTDATRPVVGDALDQCADVAGCPFAALQQLPASVAVVIRVSRAEGAVHGEVSVYDQGGTAALEVRHYIIEPGAESAFAREVATLTSDVLSLRPPASSDDMMEAARLVKAADSGVSAAVVPKPTTQVEPEPAPQPEPAPMTPPEPARDISELSFEERLEGTDVAPRFIAGSKKHFMKSELDPRDWLFKSRSHAGRLVLEVRAGYAFGDLDRAADVRVVVGDSGLNLEEWYQEGPIPAQRIRGALFVGYAPLTWMDFGAFVALQYSQKHLSTGWRFDEETGFRSGDAEPVPALMIDLQARVRFYPVPVGLVKPYVFAGGDLRVFDEFHIIDPQNPPVDYPDPAGGAVPGVSGGAGILFDAGPIVGFFVEGMFTYHLGLRAGAAETGTKPNEPPPAPDGVGYTVVVAGGVQFRI